MTSLKRKNKMSSFDLAAIVGELKEVIIGHRIKNIYQINPLTFLLAIQPSINLIVEIGRRIHLTRYISEKPKFPSNFCRVLRKHLRRGVIEDVEMPDFERLIILTVRSKASSYKLVFELFSKGNVVLLNHAGEILHASSYRRMRDRNIVRGEVFSLPPPRGIDPAKVSREDLAELRWMKGNVVRALSHLLAVGGIYVEEILNRAEVDKGEAAGDLEEIKLDRIYREVKALASSLSSEKRPQIVLDREGKFVDVLPFPLTLYSGYPIREYPTFNEAADDYFTNLSFKEEKSVIQAEIRRKTEAQRRIIEQQKERLKELEKESREKRRIGEVIYAHARELEVLARIILEERKRGKSLDERFKAVKEKESATVNTNFIKSIDFEKGTFTLEIEGLRFDLNFRKSVYMCASHFYEEAKKAEEKINGVREAIAKTREKISGFERLEAKAEKVLERPKRMRKKRWYEKFRWFRSSEGCLVIGGRDAVSNELIIKRHTGKDDVVLHAEVPGAPFFVIKTEGKTPSEQTIGEAAQCAASYSSAWKSGFASIDVYWVKAAQVSKAAPSGEYLTKGAFMIYGRKNYLKNVPLRISIGIVMTEGRLMVIGGPPSAISSQTKYHLNIVPGRRKSGKLSLEIRRRLAEMVPRELKEEVLDLSIEEFQRFVPSGGVEIDFR